MRALLLAAVIFTHCAPKERVALPGTPEGKKCWRECQAMHVACRKTYDTCESYRQKCLITCPGAYMVPVD